MNRILRGGYAATLLGYIVGGGLGGWIGVVMANRTAAGDLSDIGNGIVWIFFTTVPGVFLGTWIALRIARSPRSQATAAVSAGLLGRC